jgi:tRNA (guanine-N7-)-methyltransferase
LVASSNPTHRRVVSDAPYPDTPEAQALKPDPKAPTHIRSFALRASHMSVAQQQAYEGLYPVWGLDYQAAALDYTEVFKRSAPVVLEIGCGMGETTAYIAGILPETNFIGVEVYSSGVGALLKRLQEQDLSNVRVLQHDAVEVVRDMVALNSLDGIHVFFPDPWHKTRHKKRRLLQSPFVKILATRLKPGGYLHCATDWEDYALQMRDVLVGEPTLVNTSEREDGYSDRPNYRPPTKFEQRGVRLGHGVWDLVFRRV